MNKVNNYIKLNISFLIVIVFLFGLVVAKLLYVAVSPTVDGIDLKAFSESIIKDKDIIRADRGTIYDVNGEVFARNISSYNVIAFLAESRTSDLTKPRHVVDKIGTAKALSPLINMSEARILELLSQPGLYQTELGPGGRDITELTKQKIEALELPGISFTKGVKRHYPNENFACYILGYATKSDHGEIIGKMGIESVYNDELKGTDGFKIYQKDALGFQIAGTPETVLPSSDGYDVYLTIDYMVQRYLEDAVFALSEYKYDWATITVADARTGAIVGSASSPNFNLNTRENIKDYNNPLTSYSYEPGSTMKIFSFMAAIENNLYKGSDIYQSGYVMVDGYRISDFNNVGWGKITYDQGFTYSSNVAAVNLAQRLGIDKLTAFYEALGFGSKTGIELPGELLGEIDLVHKTDLAGAAFGQGITTTPIQNVQALTAITNNGTILKPYVISKIVNKNTGEIVYQGKRTEGKRVASEATVNKIVELMDAAINNSDPGPTARRYKTKSLTLIGKTGTAQYALPNGKYSSGGIDSIKSFAGIFPKDAPEYIIYVSIKKFRGTNLQMADVVKTAIEAIAKYKNLEDRPTDINQSKIITIGNYVNQNKSGVIKNLETLGLVPIIIGNGNTIIKQAPSQDMKVIKTSKVFLLTNAAEYQMPDVIGWNSSEIITFANLIKLPYNIKGYGRVKETSIVPGTIINPGSTLDITMDNRSD